MRCSEGETSPGGGRTLMQRFGDQYADDMMTRLVETRLKPAVPADAALLEEFK